VKGEEASEDDTSQETSTSLSEEHTEALSRVLNFGENRQTLEGYKKAVLESLTANNK